MVGSKNKTYFDDWGWLCNVLTWLYLKRIQYVLLKPAKSTAFFTSLFYFLCPFALYYVPNRSTPNFQISRIFPVRVGQEVRERDIKWFPLYFISRTMVPHFQKNLRNEQPYILLVQLYLTIEKMRGGVHFYRWSVFGVPSPNTQVLREVRGGALLGSDSLENVCNHGSNNTVTPKRPDSWT